LTELKYTKEEMKCLNIGFQFSIEKSLKTYSTNLTIETENAIKISDTKLESVYRILTTKILKQIFNSNNSYNILHKRQLYVIKQIKQKIVTENAKLFQTDKGKTILAVQTDTYVYKERAFLAVSHFPNIYKDPTEKYQKLIHKTLQQYNKIIHKHKIKYLNQKKPSRPTLKVELKLHKLTITIRPVTNNMNAPTYKMAKQQVRLLNKHLTLNNSYIVSNSTNLANDIIKLKLKENHKHVTFDIKDLFVNIPIEETLVITRYLLMQNNDIQSAHQKLNLMKLTL